MAKIQLRDKCMGLKEVNSNLKDVLYRTPLSRKSPKKTLNRLREHNSQGCGNGPIMAYDITCMKMINEPVIQKQCNTHYDCLLSLV